MELSSSYPLWYLDKWMPSWTSRLAFPSCSTPHSSLPRFMAFSDKWLAFESWAQSLLGNPNKMPIVPGWILSFFYHLCIQFMASQSLQGLSSFWLDDTRY